MRVSEVRCRGLWFFASRQIDSCVFSFFDCLSLGWPARLFLLVTDGFEEVEWKGTVYGCGLAVQWWCCWWLSVDLMLESFKQLSVIGARVQKFTSDKGWALGTGRGGRFASAPIEGDGRIEWDVWETVGKRRDVVCSQCSVSAWFPRNDVWTQGMTLMATCPLSKWKMTFGVGLCELLSKGSLRGGIGDGNVLLCKKWRVASR